jgi:hypothetical protein
MVTRTCTGPYLVWTVLPVALRTCRGGVEGAVPEAGPAAAEVAGRAPRWPDVTVTVVAEPADPAEV